MAYTIFKIYNDVNNKVYIGTTSRDMNECLKSYKSRARLHRNDGPLSTDMCQIGTYHFYVNLIEVVDTKAEAKQRAIY